MIRIALDCYGGDNSPAANIEGAFEALKNLPDLELILAGDEEQIKNLVAEEEEKRGVRYADRISVIHAPDIISCSEKPTDAIRHKPESSMMKCINLLRTDPDVAGMVSVGSTGALIAAATLRIGRLEGVMRPTFCPILPTMDGGIVGICDSGANVDCDAYRLHQFAVMGSVYMKNAFGVENPRVALLNVGVEAEKGDMMRKEAYPLIAGNKNINFVGNMESRDLLSGKYDLVVCDGFSGNVLVKSVEGTAVSLLKKLKGGIMSKLKYKIGGLFMKGLFSDMKEMLNYQKYGGSILLGCRKVVVKGHGSSDCVSVAKCIEQAYTAQTNNMNEQIEKLLSE